MAFSLTHRYSLDPDGAVLSGNTTAIKREEHPHRFLPPLQLALTPMRIDENPDLGLVSTQ